MKKLFGVVVVGLVFGAICNKVTGQSTSIDSLYRQLENQPDDSLRVILLNQIGYELSDVYVDSALDVFHKAGTIASQNGFEYGIALTAYNKSNLYSYVAKLDSASIYAMTSLKYFESIADTVKILGQTRTIAKIYQMLNQMEESWQYYQKANVIAQAKNNPRDIGTSFNDIGSYYLNLGWLRTDSLEHFFRKAEPYLLQAIEYYQKADYQRGVAFAYGNLAFIAEETAQFEKAIRYSRRAMAYFEDLNLKLFMVASYNQLGKIYETIGIPDSTLKYGGKCMELALELDSKIDLRNACARMANAHGTLGNFEEAWKYQKKYHSYAMEIVNEQNNQALIDVEAKYEAQKKDAENELLKKDNIIKESTIRKQRNLILYAILIIALLVISAFLIYRAYTLRKNLLAKIREQNTKIEKDKDLIEHQKSKLEELDKAKSRFFANISHDLRSPLTMVMGSIRNVLADESTYLTNSAEENLKTGLRNSERMIKLSDEIIDLSVLEEGKLSLKFQEVQILPYLKRLVGMFSSSAQAKGLTLHFNATIDQNTGAKIDPEQFEKIIYNLLSNAIKYTEEHGRVSVGIEKSEENVRINITDTGTGIPPESLPHIFDRYYQSPSNRYRSREGLGIGLSLVKELVGLHEGTISVDSKVDAGTTFQLSFPMVVVTSDLEVIPEVSHRLTHQHVLDELHHSEASTNSPIGEISFDQQDQEEFKVLIVEDHPEIRNYINDIITSKYRTLLTNNGKEALKAMEDHKVDLVVTDLMMPWMDGFELLEAMHIDERLQKIPVLVLSARTDEKDRFKVLNTGVNDFLSKPFKREELLLRVQNLLHQRENWENNNDLNALSDESLKKDLKEDIVQKMEAYIIGRIDDPELSVNDLGRELAASERQVYRLTKKVSGMTPYEFIKEVRYQYAHHLIRNKKVKNLSEAAKAIGMSNPSHFKTQYNKRFDNILK